MSDDNYNPKYVVKRETVKAYVEIETLQNGDRVLTLMTPRYKGQWCKILVSGGGNLVTRAVNAVYHKGERYADCFLEAAGMSDFKAFGRGTWGSYRPTLSSGYTTDPRDEES